MERRTITKRIAGISATVALVGAGLAMTAEAAVAQTGIVDVNGLLRLLDLYDLNPFF